MATKPDRVVKYSEELCSMKSHEPLSSLVILISIRRFVDLERKQLTRRQFLVVLEMLKF